MRIGSVKFTIENGSPVLGSNIDRDTSVDALVLFSAKANISLDWSMKVTPTSAGTFGTPSNTLWCDTSKRVCRGGGDGTCAVCVWRWWWCVYLCVCVCVCVCVSKNRVHPVFILCISKL
jgi:hypothetical protein